MWGSVSTLVCLFSLCFVFVLCVVCLWGACDVLVSRAGPFLAQTSYIMCWYKDGFSCYLLLRLAMVVGLYLC
jgi:hypothetical protein